MEPTASETEQPNHAEVTTDVAVTSTDSHAMYYLEGGLRRVQPYHFTYHTNCKERWRGREILDIFCSEFRDRDLDYYVRYKHVHEYSD